MILKKPTVKHLGGTSMYNICLIKILFLFYLPQFSCEALDLLHNVYENDILIQ